MGYVRRKRSVGMALPVTMLNGSESGPCDVVDGRCVAGAGYQWRSSLNPANNASAAACRHVTESPHAGNDELVRVKEKYCRVITRTVRKLAGKRGLFQRVTALYDSLKDSDPVVKELRTHVEVRRGSFLLGQIQGRMRLVNAWDRFSARKKAAELDGLLEKLETYRARISEDICPHYGGLFLRGLKLMRVRLRGSVAR